MIMSDNQIMENVLMEQATHVKYLLTEVVKYNDSMEKCRQEVFEFLQKCIESGIKITSDSNSLYFELPSSKRQIMIGSINLMDKHDTKELKVAEVYALFKKDKNIPLDFFYCTFLISTSITNCAAIFYNFLLTGVLPSNDPLYRTSTQC